MSTYKPLSTERREIRLINLLSTSSENPVSCNLTIASLEDNSLYTALSYVWGDAENTRPILLNGRVHKVTVNLECALRHLRHRISEPQKVWVDALCINQQDDLERSQQVLLMNTIYTKSNNTIIWLGGWTFGTSDDERNAVQNIWHLLKDLASGKHLVDIPILRTTERDGKSGRNIQSEMCSIFRSLMDQPYWNRVWVVQEFVLPDHTELVCGPFSLGERHDWVRAAQNLELHLGSCCSDFMGDISREMRDTLLGFFTKKIRPLYYLLQRERDNVIQKTTLSELLIIYRSREASNHRDKIYAFLGLAGRWVKGEPLLPDYTLPTDTLYKQVACKIIEDLDSLLPILPCLRKKCYEQLPSWVPDWTAPPEISGLHDLEWIFAVDTLFNASGSIPKRSEVLDNSILAIEGVKIDVLKQVTFGSGSISFLTLIIWENIFEGFFNARQTIDGKFAVNNTRRDAFLRTVLGDLIICRSDQPSLKGVSSNKFRRARQEDLDILGNALNKIKGGADLKSMFDSASMLVREVLGSASSASTQSMFFTRHGCIGRGPELIRPGDEIWVSGLSPVPVVLRPLQIDCPKSESSINLHQLVGHCYVHGVMDGEATKHLINTNQLEVLYIT